MKKNRTFRVWMKDGYCSLVNAPSEAEAKISAVEIARKNIDGLAMTSREQKNATTVKSCEDISARPS